MLTVEICNSYHLPKSSKVQPSYLIYLFPNLSGCTQVIYLNFFAHTPAIDVYAMNTHCEVQKKILNIVACCIRAHTERTMLIQFKGALLLRIDYAELMVIVINKPGN